MSKLNGNSKNVNVAEEPKPLVPLATAHVTQHTNEGVKGEWALRTNIDNDLLEKFPPYVNDELMFHILDFARKYELAALNIGIQHGKMITVKVYDKIRLEFDRQLNEAKDENVRLATILDEHIKRGTDGIN